MIGITDGIESSIHSANNSTSRRYAARVFAADAVSDDSNCAIAHFFSRRFRTTQSPFRLLFEEARHCAHVD